MAESIFQAAGPTKAVLTTITGTPARASVSPHCRDPPHAGDASGLCGVRTRAGGSCPHISNGGSARRADWSSWLTLAGASCTWPSRAIRPRRGLSSNFVKRSRGTRHLDIWSATGVMRSTNWRQLWAMGMQEVPTAPRASWQKRSWSARSAQSAESVLITSSSSIRAARRLLYQPGRPRPG